ncbi:MAG: methyltransferase domain-containing protein [Oscillospiraceae bacterium]|nr:methyltransferase domain-containing protein [Oscillospiraceae bacterium]
MNETKFDGKGSVYAKYRPAYPQAFIDYIYTNIGMCSVSIIADIGSGTGILTKQLLEKGSTVFAVEPNADMRIHAESSLGGFPDYISVDGTAERTTLSESSVDYVTAAQAFHWFDKQAFKTECRRILRKNGRVVLVWNSRVEESDIVQENYEVKRKYCPNFKVFSDSLLHAENEGCFNDFFTGEYVSRVFNNDISLDAEGFVGGNLSSSYALNETHEYYYDFIAELKQLFVKYSKNGKLVLPSITQCYVGEV